MTKMETLVDDALAAATELCESATSHGHRCENCPLWVEANTVDPKYDHYGETQPEEVDYCLLDWLSDRAEEQ